MVTRRGFSMKNAFPPLLGVLGFRTLRAQP